ncbi:hypothetical protein E4T50_10307 [Aureobasidium sp. EXF-12298]|nr:hypothetical protein E4T50_10307 [Aureobasidium sp. EXF-12298]KAI4763868.1 hypothetical protein E4T51_03114 [Aureobasidium sp. EXF-12344]KAI4780904.1 hypothetical protein E4T52_04188 [Aureobasidium sp. EXF-3400]
MPFCQGLNPSEELEVMEIYTSTRDSTAAQNHAWSLLGQKRKHNEPEATHHDIEEPTTESEATSPSSRLRKRARVSYLESPESDIESDADSGYNSDSSVEWVSRAKQIKTKRPRKEKPVKPFPFLSLPSELRNKIYSLALEDPDGMVLDEGWRAHRRVPKRCQWNLDDHLDRSYGLTNLAGREPDQEGLRSLVPSLLAVNKQIYAEAAAMLYSQPLHFTCTTALHSFLAPLSCQTASLVHSIILHRYETWGRGVRKAMNVSALTLLSKCSNLNSLRIEGFNEYYQLRQRYPYGSSKITPQNAGKYEGKGIAQQMYRDAAFWFDSISAEKALQVLDISGLQRETGGWDQKSRDDAEEALRIANVVYAEELTALIERRGRGAKKGKRSKAVRAGD